VIAVGLFEVDEWLYGREVDALAVLGGTDLRDDVSERAGGGEEQV